MNITNLRQKIKSFLDSSRNAMNGEVGTILLIILVGFAGFGLGRMSLIEDSKSSISIKQSSFTKATEDMEKNIASVGSTSQGGEVELPFGSSTSQSSGLVVTSKNGTKYHYPWCSGAKRMNEENKVFFNSIEDAREAGYTPASNCKGLR